MRLTLMGESAHSGASWWLDGPLIVHLVRMQVGDHDLAVRGQLHPRCLTLSTKGWPLEAILVCVRVRQGGWVFRVRRRHRNVLDVKWTSETLNLLYRILKPIHVTETHKSKRSGRTVLKKMYATWYCNIFKPLKQDRWTITLLFSRGRDKSYKRYRELRGSWLMTTIADDW